MGRGRADDHALEWNGCILDGTLWMGMHLAAMNGIQWHGAGVWAWLHGWRRLGSSLGRTSRDWRRTQKLCRSRFATDAPLQRYIQRSTETAR